MREEDGSLYECTAENGVGPSLTKLITIAVTGISQNIWISLCFLLLRFILSRMRRWVPFRGLFGCVTKDPVQSSKSCSLYLWWPSSPLLSFKFQLMVSPTVPWHVINWCFCRVAKDQSIFVSFEENNRIKSQCHMFNVVWEPTSDISVAQRWSRTSTNISS